MAVGNARLRMKPRLYRFFTGWKGICRGANSRWDESHSSSSSNTEYGCSAPLPCHELCASHLTRASFGYVLLDEAESVFSDSTDRPL
jgi:hypothetical protein